MKPDWDFNNDSAQFLKKVGVNAYEYTSRTKKKFVVASRDFALNMLFNLEKDGTVVICGSSENFRGNCPSKPSTVRGWSPLSGYLLEPHPTEKKTHITMVNELDFKGSIPEFALRQGFKDQGYQIVYLRKAMPKFKKLFPGEQP